MDIRQISQQLAGRAESVARMLLPGGRREGHEWKCGSVDGGEGKSLAVHLAGEKAGVWADFATGDKGDLLDLWTATKGIPLADAIKEAKAYLGVTEPRFTGSRQPQYKKPQPTKATKPNPTSPVMEYLVSRNLTPEVIAAYQLGEIEGSYGPEIVFPFKRGDETINVKYLALKRTSDGKKISRFEQGCMMILFGWQVIAPDAREVVITEGELDALSWYQCGVPALSIPNGAKAFTWLANEYEALERFETIYLSWDADEEGQKGLIEALDRLGRHRCRVVKLPFKDANACLEAGVTALQMREYLEQAQTQDPSELKRASSYVDEVIDEFYPPSGVLPGFAAPWVRFQEIIRFRPSELSIWSGFNYSGKTTLLNQIILAGMAANERACIASLEVRPRKLLRRMTRQALAIREPIPSQIRSAFAWYDGRLWIFELVGSAKTDRLLEVFQYARSRYGVTQFVIDSLLRCGIAEDDYNGQKNFTDQVAEFATSHDVHVHLVAHSRKPQNEQYETSRFDVRGASAITDLAHNVFIVKRARDKEKQIDDYRTAGEQVPQKILDRPDTTLICDKNREGEWTGRAGLWFDIESLQYVDDPARAPKVYVPDVGDRCLFPDDDMEPIQ